MLPFFGHHDRDIARTAVRVYVMRLYRAYDIVALDVSGYTGSSSSRAHSPDSDIGLPTKVGGVRSCAHFCSPVILPAVVCSGVLMTCATAWAGGLACHRRRGHRGR